MEKLSKSLCIQTIADAKRIFKTLDIHIKPFDKTSQIAAIEYHSSYYCHISTGMLLAGNITKP